MIPSKTSPKGGKRGCLCANGTYSSECCTGELIAQGIGATEGGVISNVTNEIEIRTLEQSSSEATNDTNGNVTQVNTIRMISGSH